MTPFEEVRGIVNRAKSLGTRVLPDGTEFIGHVPRVAPEAYLHLLFTPLTQAALDQLTTRLGRSVPLVFRDFLKLANGISLFSGSLSIYGLRRSFERTGDAVWQPFSVETPNTIERPRTAKPSYLFVGGYRADGSKLVLDSMTDKVYRCARFSCEVLNQWEGFWQMLVSEANRLAALFDQQGKKLEPNEPTTPH